MKREQHHYTFGEDRFGQMAEKVARFFGTPQYIVGQSVVVLIWIGLNTVAITHGWDPYPFILLNLMFSTQAAYAAPLILLAQTRQADRDKIHMDASTEHREEVADHHTQLLEHNTHLTKKIQDLTEEVHKRITG